MARSSNAACSENYCKVKKELVSDGNDQLTPPEEALCLLQDAEKEENLKLQMYKEELYADHVIKEELVLGPDVLQQPDSVVSPTATNTDDDSAIYTEQDLRVHASAVRRTYTNKLKGIQSLKILQGEENANRRDRDKGIKNHNSLQLEPQCYKANKVAIIETGNTENDKADVIENENKNLKSHLSLDTVQDSQMSESLNSLKENAISCELNLASHCSYSECEYQTVTSEFWEKHFRLHDRSSLFVCPSCGLCFNTKQISLLNHVSQCSSTKTRSKEYLRKHIGDKPYSCAFCKYRCSTNRRLKVHLRMHTGEKPYSCTFCKYSCSQSSYLKTHLRTHTGEKPYYCSFCKYSCKTNSSLKVHLRIHTGEKPYSCTFCKFRCITNGRLKEHLRMHIGE